ncbi:MAG TPA: CBS domain-containing protein [Saprospiraceae bacterium]|jgi:CBS domain-containing protein|nr:CBS domain-containing protein [Saprospiraceae bacterium]HMS29221.1 CBS domain-containing protein [Saprospiraceae bacterium]
MMNEKVSQIMTSNLITVNPNDNLHDIKEIMISKKIQHVPVTEDRQLKGMLSMNDIFKKCKEQQDLSKVTAKDVMTPKVAYIEPSDKIGTAAEVFMEHLFHAIPVVENGELVGIVTTFDVLKYAYNKEYPPRA